MDDERSRRQGDIGEVSFAEDSSTTITHDVSQEQPDVQIHIDESIPLDGMEVQNMDATKETSPVVEQLETHPNRGKWGSRLSFIITTVQLFLY
jgi:hypothetical protein